MMQLANSEVKAKALTEFDLLRDVVAFKDRFYHQAWANYGAVQKGILKLYPPEHIRKALETDYKEMQIMIFGETPKFSEIMDAIKSLEVEINEQLRI